MRGIPAVVEAQALEELAGITMVRRRTSPVRQALVDLSSLGMAVAVLALTAAGTSILRASLMPQVLLIQSPQAMTAGWGQEIVERPGTLVVWVTCGPMVRGLARPEETPRALEVLTVEDHGCRLLCLLNPSTSAAFWLVHPRRSRLASLRPKPLRICR